MNVPNQNLYRIRSKYGSDFVKSNATIDRSTDANKYSDVAAKLCTGLACFETKYTFCICRCFRFTSRTVE